MCHDLRLKLIDLFILQKIRNTCETFLFHLFDFFCRIENRVRKGGHDIPKEDVHRRYSIRFQSLNEVIPYCDEVIFYDNENGFVKVAEIKNDIFRYTNGYRPKWLSEFEGLIESQI